MKRLAVGVCLGASAVWLVSAPLQAQSLLSFSDVTRASGIVFRHTDGGWGDRYLVEAVASGLATFDYDRDGYVDVYFLNGAPLRGTIAAPTPRNAMYRNEANWKFRDVTLSSGLGDVGFGLGVAVADYDGDGFQDVFVNNFGPNSFYRNNGDGTFSNMTADAGLTSGNEVGAGACFLDIDADGNLDLYVANYVKFSYETTFANVYRGRKHYPGPAAYPPEPDVLFRSNGDGTFMNVSQASRIGRHAEWGMGVVAADLDDDGDTDIFVANDSTRNFLFLNDGQGRFEEAARLYGVAFDRNGDPQGSMGADLGDYNGDGRLDIIQTAYQNQYTTLYENLGGALFHDVTLPTGAGKNTFRRVGWGTGLVDCDDDGDLDLFIANGHIHDNMQGVDDTSSYRQFNQVLENRGGRFVDVSGRCGDGLRAFYSSRGACLDDLDNDGLIDVVVLNSRELPTVLRNRSAVRNNWLQIELVGQTGNRDGVGARVAVTTPGNRPQIAHVLSGRGYQSHFGSRLHFGLGKQTRIEQIEVRWNGGSQDIHRDLPANQLIQIRQGGGAYTKFKTRP